MIFYLDGRTNFGFLGHGPIGSLKIWWTRFWKPAALRREKSFSPGEASRPILEMSKLGACSEIRGSREGVGRLPDRMRGW
jgi:hypothetical protein